MTSGSALGKRAADTLANAELNALNEPKPDSKTLDEIKETTERLASELNDYLTLNETTNIRPDFANLSDEAIADIQLATARKLREVGANAIEMQKQVC